MYKYTEYLPPYLRNVREIQELGKVIDPEAGAVREHMEQTRANQFIDACDAATLRRQERLRQIYANPTTESMEFRRARLISRYSTKLPLTMNFLLQRLDEIIGEDMYQAWITYGDWYTRLGSWKLGTTPFRDEPYTLHIEAVTASVEWYQEVHILVNKIKPANIVFSFSPLVARGIEFQEAVGTGEVKWHTRLGSWRLGANPFREVMEMEVVKVPEVSSLQQQFLSSHAQHSAAIISAARINGSLIIENVSADVTEQVTTVSYTLPFDTGIHEITEIELLGSDGAVLSHNHVYVPVPGNDQIVLKHLLSHKEAHRNG